MSNLNNSSLTVPEINTDKLVINGTPINGIGELVNDNRKLAHSKAIFLALQEMKQIVDKVNQKIITNEDTAVISESTISPIFDPKDGWVTSGYCTILNTLAVFDPTVGATEDHHYFKVPSKAFPYPGKYILHFNVNKLTDCKLVVKDRNEAILAVIVEKGEKYLEIDVDDSNNNTIKLEIIDHETSSFASISHFNVYFVREKFHKYLINKLEEIAAIDASGYVTHEKLKQVLAAVKKDYIEKINSVVAAFNNYVNNYKNHTHTPDQCGAAHVDHTHLPEDIGASAIGHVHMPNECGAAPFVHAHDEYVLKEKLDTDLDVIIDKKRYMLPVTAAQTVVKAPVSVLPNEYKEVSIDPFVTILNPSILDHHGNNGYDTHVGTINITTEYSGRLGNLLSTTNNEFVNVNHVGCFVHIHLNSRRRIKGYSIIGKDLISNATDWEVYQDLGTHVHNATASTNQETTNITFTSPLEFNIITFKFNDSKKVPFTLKILLDFDDTINNGVVVVPDEVKLSVANKGGTSIFSLDNKFNQVIPEITEDKIPIHVFAYFKDGLHAGYHTTHILPEVGKRRMGRDITTGLYHNGLTISATQGCDHPTAGNITLEKYLDYGKVFDILNKKDDFTVLDTQVVDIIHRPIRPLLFTGYTLEINPLDRINIPTWSLEVLEPTDTGDIKKVVDTVLIGESLDGKYIFQLPEPLMAVSTKLILRSKNNISIKNYVPKYSDVYYSVPENTMYIGNTKATIGYIGTIKKVTNVITGTKGYTTTCLPIGNSCTIPVNELSPCKKLMTYRVINPYFSDMISISPRAIGKMNKSQPALDVTAITEEYIEVMAYSNHTFVLDIIREW